MINQKLFLPIFIVLFFLFSIQVSTAENKDTVLVLGYLSKIKNKAWTNGHVGFGVQNQLKQVIYNSDKFFLKEEKNIINKDASKTTNQVNDVQQDNSWMLSLNDINEASLTQKARQMDVDLIFWVEVLSFGKLNSKLFFGPFSSSTKRTNLVVKSCVFIKNKGKSLCELGLGKSRRKSSSYFFTLKEHRNGQKIFDGSKVGKISNVAVIKGTNKLLEKLASEIN